MAAPASKIGEYIAELVDNPPEFRIYALIREMKQALGTAPNKAVLALLQTGLGIAFALLDREADAVEHHAAACRLDQDNFVNANNYAVSLDRFGRTEDALEWYFNAAESPNGHNAEVLGNLALQLSKVGSADDARELFEEAVRVALNAYEINHLAQKAAQLGYYDASLALLCRHAVITLGEEYRGLPIQEIITRAPDEWRRKVLNRHELLVAVQQPALLPDLTELLTRLPRRPSRLDVDAPVDDEAFAWASAARDRALIAELSERADG